MSRKQPKELEARAYKKTRSILRMFRFKRAERAPSSRSKEIRVAFIHSNKRTSAMQTGAAQINRLMADALSNRGVRVRDFYPRTKLVDAPIHLKGIANILFFYSLLEHKKTILRNDIIQGTTYTPLPFLTFEVPVVCHFGSTARGFLDATPRTSELVPEERDVYKELVRLNVIPEFDFGTLRPIEDVADIETLAASRAATCVATSVRVRDELLCMNVPEERITVIHNAIEDYWFSTTPPQSLKEPHLVFLGRLGNDVFTLKLKGFSRLVQFCRAFPEIEKTTVCMTTNRKLKEWLRVAFPRHFMFVNLRKDLIAGALAPLYGSILFLSSRYEGFSLSLVEGMSQGLVPISFAVGVAPEIIVNGENGYIVSSTKEAIDRAKELLANPELRLRMAAAARETARAFTSSRIADEFHALYSRLRQRPPSSSSE